MSWLANLSAGMNVMAQDGPVGTVVSVPRVEIDDPTLPADVIVLANPESAGPGEEEVLRVPREMIERVERDTIYLNAERRAVPRASSAVAATHRLKMGSSGMTMRAHEEVVEVTPRVVERGYLSIKKKVGEYLDEQTVRLSHDEVQVEHVPVDEIVPDYIAPYMDGDVYVVPVIEEEVVIQRRLRLKEEIRVRRNTVERTETIQTPFRRERVVVTEHHHNAPDDEPVEH